MSEERFEAIEKAIKDLTASGGASVTFQDPRVSRFQNWIFATVGAGIIAGAIWVGTSMNGMRDAIVKLASQGEYVIEQLKDHNQRLRDLERGR